MTTRLSGTGIWSGVLRYGDAGQAAALAAELEALGYSALWVPDIGGDLFGAVGNLLGATTAATVATGILNIWMHTPDEAATEHARLTVEHGHRVVFGLGVSHRPLIDRVNEPGTYQKPIETMASYLDGLDAAPVPLAPQHRVIAALGPRMLELARGPLGRHASVPGHPRADPQGARRDRPRSSGRQRTGRRARDRSAKARDIGRVHLEGYLGLPNYTNNWKRQGFTDDDLADGGSDRLVDALVVWGDEASIAARVQEHRDAGADHVCIQVLTEDPRAFPADHWRTLAPALT